MIKSANMYGLQMAMSKRAGFGDFLGSLADSAGKAWDAGTGVLKSMGTSAANAIANAGHTANQAIGYGLGQARRAGNFVDNQLKQMHDVGAGYWQDAGETIESLGKAGVDAQRGMMGASTTVLNKLVGNDASADAVHALHNFRKAKANLDDIGFNNANAAFDRGNARMDRDWNSDTAAIDKEYNKHQSRIDRNKAEADARQERSTRKLENYVRRGGQGLAALYNSLFG